MNRRFDILFRVDASPAIGTGHLMRCLALAGVLQEQGASCAFLMRDKLLGNLASLVEAGGHTLLALAGEAPTLEPEQQQQDAACCRAALQDHARARWLVVDHYSLDARWQTAMRPVADSLMVIDDLANRPHDCDLLLDQNFVPRMETRYAGKLPSTCRQLLGPRHALLRPEFRRESQAPSQSSNHPPRLLLMFGGADPQALSLRVLRILALQDLKAEMDVVVGGLFAHLQELRQLVGQLPRAQLHVASSDIAGLMRRADLAVGSPGVSSWERCTSGLPTIAISQADNQEEIGAALAEAGVHLYLGRAETVTDLEIEAALALLCHNRWLRLAMSRAAMQICDGEGARRVARHLLGPVMSLRSATLDDAPQLFAWRNDERTRSQSLDRRELHYAAHVEWMKRVLADANEILLIGLDGSVEAACVRFSLEVDRARISIYTDPDRHGHGIGSAALAAATQWLRKKRPDTRLIEADVLQDNAASKAMFRTAGYLARFTRYEYRLKPSTHGDQGSDDHV